MPTSRPRALLPLAVIGVLLSGIVGAPSGASQDVPDANGMGAHWYAIRIPAGVNEVRLVESQAFEGQTVRLVIVYDDAGVWQYAASHSLQYGETAIRVSTPASGRIAIEPLGDFSSDGGSTTAWGCATCALLPEGWSLVVISTGSSAPWSLEVITSPEIESPLASGHEAFLYDAKDFEAVAAVELNAGAPAMRATLVGEVPLSFTSQSVASFFTTGLRPPAAMSLSGPSGDVACPCDFWEQGHTTPGSYRFRLTDLDAGSDVFLAGATIQLPN